MFNIIHVAISTWDTIYVYYHTGDVQHIKYIQVRFFSRDSTQDGIAGIKMKQTIHILLLKCHRWSQRKDFIGLCGDTYINYS